MATDRNHDDDDVDLNGLTLDEVRDADLAGCEHLATQIRRFLVKNISRSGGHLGANLGVVELTIAIHRTFDSPTVPIIFDIGHQAYTHKILTGRAGGFSTFRERNGLSGFPARSESIHDTVENSHSSTGPAWALGMSLARDTPSVVVIGDGALTGGVAFEAINAIGVRKAPVVLIYNDNGRSYARTVSRLTLGEPSDAEQPFAGGQENVEQFFSALGFTYVGPADGNDLGKLEATLRDAKELRGPVAVHVRTQKGLGWAPAETDDVMRQHQVPGIVPAPTAPMDAPLAVADRTWGESLGTALCDMAQRDPRVHVITAAMPDSLGLLDFQRRFPDRFHDVGICEQLAVGLAAGLASQGFRPVFPVFATFLTRALDQVVNDVALHRLPVTFVVDRAGITGGDGASSHGIYDVGLLRMVPGLEIFSPTSAEQLNAVLCSAVDRTDGPTAIRYAKWKPLVGDITTAADRAVRRRRGTDLCLLTHGAMVQPSMSAAAILERDHGVSTTVWEVLRLRPAPAEVFADALRHHAVLTIEDLVRGSGLYPVLLAHLPTATGSRPATGEVALPEEFLPWGSRDELLTEFGLDTATVVSRALEMLGLTAPSRR